MSHLLSRNIRIEEDLVDQLFNSSEKRLARILLLLAHFGKESKVEELIVPKISQETLADMVGTTRSRVSFFLNKFRKLGFIDYNGGLRILGSRRSLAVGRIHSSNVSNFDQSAILSLWHNFTQIHTMCIEILRHLLTVSFAER
jgi:hypothetical protein